MSTLREWIEELAEGQPVIGVVLGEFGWGGYREEGKPIPPKGEVLTWEQAQPFINYTFDNGYGAPNCHAIYAWTRDWVMFVVQYDGATQMHRVPSSPCNIKPEMPGG